MKSSVPHAAVGIAFAGLAVTAHAQFFNAPAMGVMMTIGQKRACSARFPELSKPLQTAFDAFVQRNSEVIPADSLRELDKPSDIEKSPIFQGIDQEQCAALIQNIPLISLRELMQEQHRLNEERQQEEKR